MAKTVGIGYQDFEKIREKDLFYVDKTEFIREWWENADEVTLITRPRRFGKTLNISMLEKFFSVRYAGRKDLFQGLAIWKDEKYQKLQGTYPVINLTFANVKETTYQMTIQRMNQVLTNLYSDYRFLLESERLSAEEKKYFLEISSSMTEITATMAIHQLSKFLYTYYGKKVIILLDEYDTPMQEAYVNGYWNGMASFTRSMFNAAFKTNPYLERAVMTGITRVSKESIFSDLNNLEVVTTTSEKYGNCFGFTEEEVFFVLDTFGLSDRKNEVKEWYDGFTFGNWKDIYNPWSILNYLDKTQLAPYWANSSSNRLVSKLLQESQKGVKQDFEWLMRGETIEVELDEQLIYEQLSVKKNAIWSLLLASGYLKVVQMEFKKKAGRHSYHLSLTNREVFLMFEDMIQGWFTESGDNYNDFVKALLLNDVDAMNEYMNQISDSVFSSFDTGKKASKSAPERFYHGFVLGLMVDLRGRYILTSNRESGFGRYDVMLEPVNPDQDDGIIVEFKVFQPKREKDLTDTVQTALKQIEEKKSEK